MSKKSKQLGMNPATASGRLVKDIVFMFLTTAQMTCHRCDQPMQRDNFSIDHIKPWLDSENPVELYFDLTNIAFSHLSCNIGAGRRPEKYMTKGKQIAARREASLKYYYAAGREKRRQKNSKR